MGMGKMLAQYCTPTTLELESMILPMAQLPHGLSRMNLKSRTHLPKTSSAGLGEHGCVAVWNDFVVDKGLSKFRFTHHADDLLEALSENVAVCFCCVEVDVND
jgi:hypothetical protein